MVPPLPWKPLPAPKIPNHEGVLMSNSFGSRSTLRVGDKQYEIYRLDALVKAGVGDVTTLANPEVVDQIRTMVLGDAPVAVKDAPDDIKNFGEEK